MKTLLFLFLFAAPVVAFPDWIVDGALQGGSSNVAVVTSGLSTNDSYAMAAGTTNAFRRLVATDSLQLPPGAGAVDGNNGWIANLDLLGVAELRSDTGSVNVIGLRHTTLNDQPNENATLDWTAKELIGDWNISGNLIADDGGGLTHLGVAATLFSVETGFPAIKNASGTTIFNGNDSTLLDNSGEITLDFNARALAHDNWFIEDVNLVFGDGGLAHAANPNQPLVDITGGLVIIRDLGGQAIFSTEEYMLWDTAGGQSIKFDARALVGDWLVDGALSLGSAGAGAGTVKLYDATGDNYSPTISYDDDGFRFDGSGFRLSTGIFSVREAGGHTTTLSLKDINSPEDPIDFLITTNSNGQALRIGEADEPNALVLVPDGSDRFNLGVGVANPVERLDVDGNVSALGYVADTHAGISITNAVLVPDGIGGFATQTWVFVTGIRTQ